MFLFRPCWPWPLHFVFICLFSLFPPSVSAFIEHPRSPSANQLSTFHIFPHHYLGPLWDLHALHIGMGRWHVGNPPQNRTSSFPGQNTAYAWLVARSGWVGHDGARYGPVGWLPWDKLSNHSGPTYGSRPLMYVFQPKPRYTSATQFCHSLWKSHKYSSFYGGRH